MNSSPAFCAADAKRSAFSCSVSVVIPVYNGAESIRLVVEATRRELGTLVDAFEIVLVNDGSPDQSWPALESLAEDFSEVTAINLTRNFGQHAALFCGFKHARNQIILTMDDDLQHPPAEIRKLLAGIAEGYDVVYGVPHAEAHGWWRDCASVASKLIFQRVLKMSNARDTSAFRAIRREVAAPFRDYSSPFIDVDAMLTWTTSRFLAVTTEHAPRQFGRSNYDLRKLLSHALNMVVNYTTLPLRLASVIGFCFTCIGLAVLVYVVARYLLVGSSVPGFAFLACIIALFSGAQLFALGLLGEYFAKVHFRIMGRPGAVEREVRQARASVVAV
jgi:undecaprenyl-phosphate 4-deoxy-4-formamido-L-arabinose transferase